MYTLTSLRTGDIETALEHVLLGLMTAALLLTAPALVALAQYARTRRPRARRVAAPRGRSRPRVGGPVVGGAYWLAVGYLLRVDALRRREPQSHTYKRASSVSFSAKETS